VEDATKKALLLLECSPTLPLPPPSPPLLLLLILLVLFHHLHGAYSRLVAGEQYGLRPRTTASTKQLVPLIAGCVQRSQILDNSLGRTSLCLDQLVRLGRDDGHVGHDGVLARLRDTRTDTRIPESVPASAYARVRVIYIYIYIHIYIYIYICVYMYIYIYT